MVSDPRRWLVALARESRSPKKPGVRGQTNGALGVGSTRGESRLRFTPVFTLLSRVYQDY